MNPGLIGDDARPYVDRDLAALLPEQAVGVLWERNRALKELEREADSWTRLLLGSAAWLLAVLGGAGLARAGWQGAPARGAGLLLGVGLLGAGGALGVRVWRAGRCVVSAYVGWTLLPERLPGGGAGVENWRSSPFLDAVEARLFVFRGWRALRIGLAALAALSPTAFWRLAVQDGPRFQTTWHEGQPFALAVLMITLTAAGLTAAVVLMSGQVRASFAHSQRDPIQRRLLGR
jgi:hypothetical protein